MQGFSQFQEDLWILENLSPPADGIFVDIGAHDGISSSNTYLFERLGWMGICVEPVLELAAKCKQNRKRETLCCAIGSGDAIQWMHIDQHPECGASSLNRLPTGKRQLVTVLPLDSICARFAPKIHLLSIDTEGTELEVWATGFLWRPTIVIVEHLTEPNPSNADRLIERFTRDGYELKHTTYANLIFKKR